MKICQRCVRKQILPSRQHCLPHQRTSAHALQALRDHDTSEACMQPPIQATLVHRVLVRLLDQVGACLVVSWCQVEEARFSLVPGCTGGARTPPDWELEISIQGARAPQVGGRGTPHSVAEVHRRCANATGPGCTYSKGLGGELGVKARAS